MKKTVVQAAVFAAAVFAVLVFAACGQLDVVGRDSVRAFQALLDTVPREVTADGAAGGWILSAPDGSARFVWSSDYSRSPLYDVMIVFEARPFTGAGLDVNRLPENITVSGGEIIAGTKLGNEAPRHSGVPTPISSYEQIVKLRRDSIGYHGAMDHYGVSLSGGNLFEWAKDMDANDKDIVFVLNPEPFISAGVDPRNIEGWVFTKVTVDDANGRPVEVDRILKFFDLR
ncbi:MAG: hypothetical protein LBI86_12555 [Treponema sp.]|jgi:hypothetical protein|nr:hypothetical protein [Treponema sp.]